MGVYIKGMSLNQLKKMGIAGIQLNINRLIEVPEPHGRLIDENDVINAVHDRLHVLQTHKVFVKKHGDIDLLGVLPYIAIINSVIEAEGEL